MYKIGLVKYGHYMSTTERFPDQPFPILKEFIFKTLIKTFSFQVLKYHCILSFSFYSISYHLISMLINLQTEQTES